MGRIEQLLQNYARHVSLPWDDSLSGPQRVWFAVYEKTDERRLRARVEEFELAIKRAGKRWHLCDLTNAFPQWMSTKEYRESYFESPDDLELALDDFLSSVTSEILSAFNAGHVNHETVVAL